MRSIFDNKNNFIINSEVKSELIWGDKDKVKSPKVSILIPTYNRTDYFYKALYSAVNQTYEDEYEIVIVDNTVDELIRAKNYKVVEELNSSKVFYYRNLKNIGAAGNFNRAIELARAPYVTYCHDDDLLLPDTLTILMKIQKEVGNKAIFGIYNEINSEGEITKAIHYNKNKIQYFQVKLFDQFIHSFGTGCGSLFCREYLLEMGGYDLEYFPSSDYAIQALYTQKYGSVRSCNPTCNYRISGNNDSSEVYKYFASSDREFRKSMKPYLHLPNFILDIIIRANYDVGSYLFEKQWGKRKVSLFKDVNLVNRLIMKCMGVIMMIRSTVFRSTVE